MSQPTIPCQGEAIAQSSAQPEAEMDRECAIYLILDFYQKRPHLQPRDQPIDRDLIELLDTPDVISWAQKIARLKARAAEKEAGDAANPADV